MKKQLLFALLPLVGCGQIHGSTIPAVQQASTIPAAHQPTLTGDTERLIPVGFYVDNYSTVSAQFTSTASCGNNPLDIRKGTLSPQQSLWDGGFFSGCLLGTNPGYVTVTVGNKADGSCTFNVQENASGWFASQGSECVVMELPGGGEKKGRSGGQMFWHLIFGGPTTQ